MWGFKQEQASSLLRQLTFLKKGKSIIAGQNRFKSAQGVLTCSGVNVAVLRNERVSMRGEKADAPRDGIVVGSHHQYQQQLEPRVRSRYCSRARAHGTTNPNQYHIFATLPTSAQFPLPFLALGSLPTHTTPQHQIPLRKQQSSLTPHTEEVGKLLQLVFENARLKSRPGSRRS